jgi:hypothetical protein
MATGRWDGLHRRGLKDATSSGAYPAIAQARFIAVLPIFWGSFAALAPMLEYAIRDTALFLAGYSSFFHDLASLDLIL